MFNGIILSVGLIVLLLFSTLSTIYEIIDMDRMKQQAITASEAKGRFLANMSHEVWRINLRTIVKVICSVLKSKPDGYILKPPDEELILKTINETFLMQYKKNRIVL